MQISVFFHKKNLKKTILYIKECFFAYKNSFKKRALRAHKKYIDSGFRSSTITCIAEQLVFSTNDNKGVNFSYRDINTSF